MLAQHAADKLREFIGAPDDMLVVWPRRNDAGVVRLIVVTEPGHTVDLSRIPTVYEGYPVRINETFSLRASKAQARSHR